MKNIFEKLDKKIVNYSDKSSYEELSDLAKIMVEEAENIKENNFKRLSKEEQILNYGYIFFVDYLDYMGKCILIDNMIITPLEQFTLSYTLELGVTNFIKDYCDKHDTAEFENFLFKKFKELLDEYANVYEATEEFFRACRWLNNPPASLVMYNFYINKVTNDMEDLV